MYRSKFEATFADHLTAHNIDVIYEKDKFKYIQPAKTRTYTPDFKINDHLYVETKGKLTVDDRKKALLFTEQYPDIRLIFIFMNSNNKLRKGSKTTYGMWCDKNNIEWYDIKQFDTFIETIQNDVNN